MPRIELIAQSPATNCSVVCCIVLGFWLLDNLTLTIQDIADLADGAGRLFCHKMDLEMIKQFNSIVLLSILEWTELPEIEGYFMALRQFGLSMIAQQYEFRS